MPTWRDVLRGDPLPWLLEPDDVQPAVRYFAMRELLGRPETDGELLEASEAIMRTGPVPAILAAQDPAGYWVKPGPGYGPKYQGTIWQVVFLAQFGADGGDSRVRAGCEYALSHNVAAHDGISINGTPSSFVHCMAGNLAAALIDLGYLEDDRLQTALEWQARTVTGDGVAGTESRDTPRRYYLSSTSGPDFACNINGRLPCAWGGVKAMLALSKVPAARRTPVMQAAVERGAEFLLSRDPAVADYPFGYGSRPNSSWFKFGYPVGYVTDVLQNLEVLAALGHARDPRLAHALELVVSKQGDGGRWKLEYTYNGKTWVDVERKGAPSKWVTVRALRVLKAAYEE